MEDNTQQKSSRIESLSNNLPHIILLGLSFLLPFFVIPFNLLIADFDKKILVTAVSLFIFILWLFLRLIDGKVVIPKSAIIASGLIVLLVSFLSSILSPAKNVSFFGTGFENGTFFSLSLAFILLFAFSIFFQNTKRIFHFFSLISLSVIVVFLIQLINLIWDGFTFFGLEGGSASVVGRWNDLGIFFGLGIIISLVALETMPLDRLFKWVTWTTLVLSVVGLVFVNFTLAWWSVIGIIGIFSLHRYFQSRNEDNPDEFLTKGQKIKKALLKPSSIVLLLALIFVVWGSERSFFREVNPIIFDNGLYRTVKRVAPSPIDARPTMGSTLLIAKEIYKEDAFLGTGLNRFDQAWRLHKPLDVNNSIFWNVQFSNGVGFVPTFFVTSGTLGVVAWLLFLASLLFTVVRYLFKKDPDKKIPSLVTISGLASLYLWLLVTIYNPGLSMFILAFMVTGVYLSSLVKIGAKENYVFQASKSPAFGFASVLLIVILLILSLVSGFIYINKARAQSKLESGVMLANEGVLAESLTVLNDAARIGDTGAAYRTLVSVGLAELSQSINDPDSDIRDLENLFVEKYQAIRDNGSKAIENDETNHLNWISLAETYNAAADLGVSGAYEAAKETYESALERSPVNPLIMFRLARLEFANGNEEAGNQLLMDALSVKSNYTPALFLRAQRAIEDGDLAGATEDTLNAAIIDPNNIGILFQLGFLQYRGGDYTSAAQALERAVMLNPQYSNARYFLGLSYYMLDFVPEAIVQFETVLELNPDNAGVALILRNLRNGLDPFASTPVADLPDRQEEPPIGEDDEE